MQLTQGQKDSIIKEYNTWFNQQYGNNTLEERQEFAQFYTPPTLAITMIEKFSDLEGKILDPTIGAGGLIAACIKAGADPKLCYGVELDKDILEKVTIPRLTKLGVPRNNLRWGNALNEDCLDFDTKGTYSFDPIGEYGKVSWGGKSKFRFGL